jgi:hypothetical protein
MAKSKKRQRRKLARVVKSTVEQEVWAALELAQKQVKHLVDREKQTERVGRDILNLRLKG